MTGQPGWCGELLPWVDGGPPSVCAREPGHAHRPPEMANPAPSVHLSRDGIAWGVGCTPPLLGLEGSLVPEVGAGVAA